MNQLKALQVFVRCVERGSFSAVAAEFSTTQPSISKLVASLESHLGGALFERAAHGVRLTPQGQHYYAQCKDIVDALARADEGFGQARDRVAGLVRLSASLAFGRLQVIPRLPDLMKQHPALEVDLQLSDRIVDLVADGIDLAFRFGALPDSDLLARRVGTSRRVTVASPAYLRRHAPPRSPADLAAHACIRFDSGGSGHLWRYLPVSGATGAPRPVRVAVAGPFRTNGPEAAREAVLAGLGVAQLSRWMVAPDLKARRMVALLENHAVGDTPIHMVFTRSARQAAKVRAVVDFFAAAFQQDPSIQP